ncbi:hypothetical protein GE21DRAFT_2620 [Neurospora crassa]|uniref:Uncharacterized protein n=1 Tax=Neurospora crassa (strain ATCC 24698 / 74-OR23-1A / CBS 708.71 / DSM 1257 / FGSC 987) TaxID=367110 RepID=Q7SFI6_NEUCR|nr:hypothetical protein NCU08635 [Neurospora crassa OR74A]EAA35607.1 hypothetical protein NCU08635 [Neurospora crassa OR74A]KHE81221.1 hypothetical protein GE21DRAFT_2620 [Neurospora crassa]|eukprot:XP_964843.1 hypothetical protein NCU08635 [Neurospora crassa OR74A]
MSPLLASAALLPPRLGFLSLPLPDEWALGSTQHQTSVLATSTIYLHFTVPAVISSRTYPEGQTPSTEEWNSDAIFFSISPLNTRIEDWLW